MIITNAALETVTADSQGVELAVGQRVAYNLSGYVVPGKIIEVKPPVQRNKWHWRDSIRIQNDSGRISHVRNGDSVLVLP